MWYLIHLVAAPLEFLLGLFCVLTAIMLYPGEEGKIQSKFEDFWIRVNDFQNLALSRHTAFMTGVAKLETRFLDRIFGHKLLSGRSIGMSVSLTLASVSGCEIVSDGLKEFHIFSMWSLMLMGSIILGGTCIFLRKRSVFVTAGLTGLVCILWPWVEWGRIAFLGDREERFYFFETGLLIAIAIVGGFVCDVAFFVVTRQLIRLAGEMTRSLRVGLVVILNLLLAICFVSPFIASEIESRYAERQIAAIHESTTAASAAATAATAEAEKHAKSAEEHSEAATQMSKVSKRCALASLAHSKTASAHSKTVLVHSEFIQQATKTQLTMPVIVPIAASVELSETKKTRREPIAERANSPEVAAAVKEIREHRERTSSLIPVDSAAQIDHAAWRARMSKR